MESSSESDGDSICIEEYSEDDDEIVFFDEFFIPRTSYQKCVPDDQLHLIESIHLDDIRFTDSNPTTQNKISELVNLKGFFTSGCERVYRDLIPAFDALVRLPRLEIVQCNNNSALGRDLLWSMSRAPNPLGIVVLTLVNCDLCVNSCKILAELFKGLPKLETLDLSGNRRGGECVPEMAKALLNAPDLKRLILQDMDIDDEEIGVISTALSSLKDLVRLDISDNSVSTSGLKALASVIPEFKKLEYLDISENDNGYDDLGILAISKAICSLKNITEFYSDGILLEESARLLVENILPRLQDPEIMPFRGHQLVNGYFISLHHSRTLYCNMILHYNQMILSENEIHERFFALTDKLPTELKMKMANVVYDTRRSFVNIRDIVYFLNQTFNKIK